MVAERLRELRNELGISKRELVATLPLNYSTYANYESGFREPNSEVLQTLARHFRVSIDYLLGVSDNRRKADEVAILNDIEHEFINGFRQLDAHGQEMVELVLQKELERVNFVNVRSQAIQNQSAADDEWIMLPVYQQRASAGLGNYLSDESNDDYEMLRFINSEVSQKADFCVKIKGSSMEPKISDGSIVFVKAVPKVEPDNVGIFIYEGETYCKRLRVDYKNSTIYLESLNKSFAPKAIQNPESLRTVGLVIGIAE